MSHEQQTRFLLARVLRRRRSNNLPEKTFLTREYVLIIVACLLGVALLAIAMRSLR